jgi:hypothetical protein
MPAQISKCLSCCEKKPKTRYTKKACIKGCKTYKQRKKKSIKFKKSLAKFVYEMENFRDKYE